jgi:DNA-directed RNA polymerase specialized sigma24 family protein
VSDEVLPPRTSDRFPTTRWSLVGRARHNAPASSPESERAALAELIRIYLPALRAHLVGPLRLDSHRADDILQGFLADKVLEQNLIAVADPNRGKFRTFLLTALERFIIDEHRRASAKKRSPGSKLLDVDELADRIAGSQTPSHAFDRAWAGEVLGEVMRRMRDECRSSDRPHLWEVFELRMLLPITDGAAPPSHEDLARRLRLESATQSANALGSAKRLFTRNFRSVVGEYAADESEVDAEIRELWEIFARPSA